MFGKVNTGGGRQKIGKFESQMRSYNIDEMRAHLFLFV